MNVIKGIIIYYCLISLGESSNIPRNVPDKILNKSLTDTLNYNFNLDDVMGIFDKIFKNNVDDFKIEENNDIKNLEFRKYSFNEHNYDLLYESFRDYCLNEVVNNENCIKFLDVDNILNVFHDIDSVFHSRFYKEIKEVKSYIFEIIKLLNKSDDLSVKIKTTFDGIKSKKNMLLKTLDERFNTAVPIISYFEGMTYNLTKENNNINFYEMMVQYGNDLNSAVKNALVEYVYTYREVKNFQKKLEKYIEKNAKILSKMHRKIVLSIFYMIADMNKTTEKIENLVNKKVEEYEEWINNENVNFSRMISNLKYNVDFNIDDINSIIDTSKENLLKNNIDFINMSEYVTFHSPNKTINSIIHFLNNKYSKNVHIIFLYNEEYINLNFNMKEEKSEEPSSKIDLKLMNKSNFDHLDYIETTKYENILTSMKKENHSYFHLEKGDINNLIDDLFVKYDDNNNNSPWIKEKSMDVKEGAKEGYTDLNDEITKYTEKMEKKIDNVTDDYIFKPTIKSYIEGVKNLFGNAIFQFNKYIYTFDKNYEDTSVNNETGDQIVNMSNKLEKDVYPEDIEEGEEIIDDENIEDEENNYKGDNKNVQEKELTEAKVDKKGNIDGQIEGMKENKERTDEVKDGDKNDVKDKDKNDVKDKDKNDVKEEDKNDVKEEDKNDVKEEDKNDVNDEDKNDVNDEDKNDVNDEDKNDVKEEDKNDVNDEDKNDVKDEDKSDVTDEDKNDVKDEDKSDVTDEDKNDVKDEDKNDVKDEDDKEDKNDVKDEDKNDVKDEDKNDVKDEDKNDLKDEDKSDVKDENKNDDKSDVKDENKNDDKSDVKDEDKNENKNDDKSDVKDEDKNDEPTITSIEESIKLLNEKKKSNKIKLSNTVDDINEFENEFQSTYENDYENEYENEFEDEYKMLCENNCDGSNENKNNVLSIFESSNLKYLWRIPIINNLYNSCCKDKLENDNNENIQNINVFEVDEEEILKIYDNMDSIKYEDVTRWIKDNILYAVPDMNYILGALKSQKRYMNNVSSTRIGGTDSNSIHQNYFYDSFYGRDYLIMKSKGVHVETFLYPYFETLNMELNEAGICPWGNYYSCMEKYVKEHIKNKMVDDKILFVYIGTFKEEIFKLSRSKTLDDLKKIHLKQFLDNEKEYDFFNNFMIKKYNEEYNFFENLKTHIVYHSRYKHLLMYGIDFNFHVSYFLKGDIQFLPLSYYYDSIIYFKVIFATSKYGYHEIVPIDDDIIKFGLLLSLDNKNKNVHYLISSEVKQDTNYDLMKNKIGVIKIYEVSYEMLNMQLINNKYKVNVTKNMRIILEKEVIFNNNEKKLLDYIDSFYDIMNKIMKNNMNLELYGKTFFVHVQRV
ncbi:conserved Plasmodium protein, unknown function [Plasmodium sp. gorilla clade G2]|uniref:conserved Plasmodium protein, unknown function n=1 Tax=Plasmodium sp. gorilla clade G2 TaxID=880535 RepID=UPI000D209ACD|nr:conserved Plasmodium protein, unknown function [Plasmodium sp. gorilla clade G2]SOV15884.1 conserved Plasmodium protein, unknown function [Plasmodium sp. gorilla clade G2]